MPKEVFIKQKNLKSYCPQFILHSSKSLSLIAFHKEMNYLPASPALDLYEIQHRHEEFYIGGTQETSRKLRP